MCACIERVITNTIESLVLRTLKRGQKLFLSAMKFNDGECVRITHGIYLIVWVCALIDISGFCDGILRVPETRSEILNHGCRFLQPGWKLSLALRNARLATRYVGGGGGGRRGDFPFGKRQHPFSRSETIRRCFYIIYVRWEIVRFYLRVWVRITVIYRKSPDRNWKCCTTQLRLFHNAKKLVVNGTTLVAESRRKSGLCNT